LSASCIPFPVSVFTALLLLMNLWWKGYMFWGGHTHLLDWKLFPLIVWWPRTCNRGWAVARNDLLSPPTTSPPVTGQTRRESRVAFITHSNVERQIPQTNELFKKDMTKCVLSERISLDEVHFCCKIKS
jgi:hypothetical protein